jgi:hypothetical protein
MSKYWYTMKLKDGGALLAYGPFTNEQCKREREKAKHSDFHVSTPFLASSKKEALERAYLFMP